MHGSLTIGRYWGNGICPFRSPGDSGMKIHTSVFQTPETASGETGDAGVITNRAESSSKGVRWEVGETVMELAHRENEPFSMCPYGAVSEPLRAATKMAQRFEA